MICECEMKRITKKSKRIFRRFYVWVAKKNIAMELAKNILRIGKIHKKYVLQTFLVMECAFRVLYISNILLHLE